MTSLKTPPQKTNPELEGLLRAVTVLSTKADFAECPSEMVVKLVFTK